jgi:hypothetical protein
MTGLGLWFPIFCAGALFDVQTVPIAHPEDRCFVTRIEDTGGADLLVLGAEELHVYPHTSPEAAFSIPLLPGTSALDIADIDGDGYAEVVTVCGEELVCYGLFPASRRKPEKMFSMKTQLARPQGQPFLHVLVIWHDGVPTLALPGEDTFELRTMGGEPLKQYPIGLDAPRHAAYGRPFTSTSVFPPQAGPPEALELRINRVMAYDPALPPELRVSKTSALPLRQGTPRQLRDAAELAPESWPWFPLHTTAESRDRVLYAISGSGYGDTLLRIQRPATPAPAAPATWTGPERRYPGLLILAEDEMPDFNGDGFVDLLLWSAPEPVPTVEALSRAITGGTWPVRVAAHLFVSEKNRYAPQAAAAVTLRVPIAWFMAAVGGTPLRHVVLRDFNGDGLTDFGCCPKANEFAAWHSTAQGWSAAPDFQYTLDDPVQRVEFRADLDASGRTSLGLRTGKSLHLLRADERAPRPSPPTPLAPAVTSTAKPKP